jgi:Dolichyl-phosphate-mannose-protein mannosyltransferase
MLFAPAKGESPTGVVALPCNMNESKPTRRSARAVLFIAAMVSAVAGQLALSLARGIVLFGIGSYLLSLLALLLLARSSLDEKQLSSPERSLIAWLNRVDRKSLLQAAMLLLAIILACVALFVAQTERPAPEYWAAFVAWLTAVLMLVGVFVIFPAKDQIAQLRRHIAENAVEVLCVGVLILIAFALRVYNVANLPYPFGGDEGSIGQETVLIAHGLKTNMFVTGWSSEPNLGFLPWAVAVMLLGENVLAIRTFAAFIGALAILTTFLWARAMFGRSTALVAAGLLAVMAVDIHFSRLALNNAEVLFYVSLEFWLTYRAAESREVYWLGAAGIVSGLAVYSYAGSRLILLLAGLSLFVVLIRDRSRWSDFPKFLAFAISAVIVVLPIAVFFWQHPDIGFSRMNQMGAFQQGWVNREVTATQLPVPLILARQFAASFLMFVSTPAFSGFYGSHSPLLDPFWAFFFMLGLILSFLSIRQMRNSFLHWIFWATIFAGGALIIPPRIRSEWY